MNHYDELRKLAARKRDRVIKQAREQYSRTIQVIAELETEIKGAAKRKRPGARRTSLTDLIFQNLPDDRSFSVDDRGWYEFKKVETQTVSNNGFPVAPPQPQNGEGDRDTVPW